MTRYAPAAMLRSPALLLEGLLLLLVLVGCPRDAETPDPPPAQPCVEDVDCAEGDAGRLCGIVRVCVDGFCEAEPSRVVPCQR